MKSKMTNEDSTEQGKQNNSIALKLDVLRKLTRKYKMPKFYMELKY